MNISIFGDSFLRYSVKELEKEGHYVLLDKFSPDIDLLITDGISKMYIVYRNLKIIKKNNIKFINFILDIPPWRLESKFYENSIIKNLKQWVYHLAHKNLILYNQLNYFTPSSGRSPIFNFISRYIQEYFNKSARNQMAYLKNYRKILTVSDLNLSISKFSQKLAKINLNIDSDVCYPCINSDLLSIVPKSKIKYDAINISRIVPHKRQDIFDQAAIKLGLNAIIIGMYQDKTIKLNRPYFHLDNHFEVLKKLSESKIYVAPSEYEGFGLTPVEAGFLDKVTIVSDIYVHREVLGDYPIYFKKNNVDNLVEKLKVALDSDLKPNTTLIKKKYSISAFKSRLLKFIESII